MQNISPSIVLHAYPFNVSQATQVFTPRIVIPPVQFRCSALFFFFFF